MIRVNLLGGQVSASGPEIVAASLDGMSQSEIQKQGILRIFLLFVIPILLFLYESQNLPDKRAQIADLNKQMEELKSYNQKTDAAVREIKKFQEDEKKIKKQIETVELLSKSRLREIKVLDLIQQVIPEKVWLKSLEFSNSKIRIRGNAATSSDITNFNDSLSRSVYLNDVQPGRESEVFFENFKVREFELSASLEKANE